MAVATIQFLNKCTYGFAGYLNCTYFTYLPSLKKPDRLTLKADNRKSIWTGVTLTSILSLFIGYLCAEFSFGGRATQFEKLFTVGFICGFTALNTSQMLLLFSTARRSSSLGVVNSVFRAQFRSKASPSLKYQLVCGFLTYVTVVYPFIYLPSLYANSWYTPNMMSALLTGIRHVGGTLNAINLMSIPEAYILMAAKFVVFLIISTALGHGVMSLAVSCNWLFSYHFSINDSIISTG